MANERYPERSMSYTNRTRYATSDRGFDCHIYPPRSGPDGLGNLDLVIKTRLIFLSPDNSYAYVNRRSHQVTSSNATDAVKIRPWDDSTRRRFFRAFPGTIHRTWNDKLYLEARRIREPLVYRALRCSVRIYVIGDARRLSRTSQEGRGETHFRVEVVRRHPDQDSVRSNCRFYTDHATLGPVNCFLDDEDVDNVTRRDSGFAPQTQKPAAHEFGHHLGLDHVNRGGSGNEYGANDDQRCQIMGYGHDVRVSCATPFLAALRRLIGTEAASVWEPRTRLPYLPQVRG